MQGNRIKKQSDGSTWPALSRLKKPHWGMCLWQIWMYTCSNTIYTIDVEEWAIEVITDGAHEKAIRLRM